MENNTNENVKVIQLTEDDFKEIALEKAAEICAAIGDPSLSVFSAILLAEISTALFENENLVIEEEE